MFTIPFAVVMLLAHAPAVAQVCPADLMRIDGVGVAAPANRLVQAYGTPIARNAMGGEHYEEEWVFDKAHAYLISGRVEHLASSRQGSCTGRGICVAGTFDDAKQRFDGFVRSGDGNSLHCVDAESAWSLVVEGTPRIRRLVLQCLP